MPAVLVHCDDAAPALFLSRRPIEQRYPRLSVEAGRLPSLLGRELFRTRVTAYQARTFEDTVIFVHELASGLAKLDQFANQLIALIALQDYTQRETARWGAGGEPSGGAILKQLTS
jgi:hypothetical protein